MPFVTHEKNGLVWLTASCLDACPGVAHGFSTRLGGVSRPPFDTLNLGIGRGDERQALEENYRRFCAAIGTDVRRVVCSRQVHGDLIHEAVEEDAGRGLWQSRDYDNDAFITNVPGLALTVFSADCGTVLLYDPTHRAIGAVHAGWRGVANGIAGKTVETMTARYGTKPEELLAALGPSICPDCFETDGDVPAAMLAAFGRSSQAHMTRRGEKWHVDLKALNRAWLLRAGMAADRIEVCTLCSACRRDLFWSHRRMGQQRGSQIAQIALL